MSVQTVSRMVCDGCNATGPETKRTRAVLEDTALKQGWRRKGMAPTWYCPQCSMVESEVVLLSEGRYAKMCTTATIGRGSNRVDVPVCLGDTARVIGENLLTAWECQLGTQK